MTPAISEIEKFWDTMCSKEKSFNENAKWIKNVQTNNANIQGQQWSDISDEDCRQP